MIKQISGGGSSYADALRKQALHISVSPSFEKCMFVISNIPSIRALNTQVKEDDKDNDVADEFRKYLFKGDRGGTIVFSLDINSTRLSTNPVKNWLIQKFQTLKNKFTISSFLKSLRRQEDIKAWTIGQYFKGSYTGEDGKQYDENSMTLNIIDIDRKTHFRIAQEICQYLNQESVLVHDATNNQIYFVTPD